MLTKKFILLAASFCIMPISGYADYKSREFCNDVKCAIQMQLNAQKKDSEEYEKIRQTCRIGCIFTTWQFHHWLMEKGYLIVRPEIRKEE